MSDNIWNFEIDGLEISHYYQDIDTSNKVDGKRIYYWTNDKNAPNNCKNAEISDLNNAGFVALISCDNITVKNLNLENNYNGILLVNTTNSKILNNNASSNSWSGLYLWNSSNNTLTGNTVNNNTWGGIRLSGSSNNTLYNNTANNNPYGIYLNSSSNNILRNNTANNNENSFYIEGQEISHYYGDVDTSNLVNGKPIYYWTNEKDAPNNCKNAEISDLDNAGFVALISCDNITVKNLNLSKNSHGILLVNTTNSKILNNTANSNKNGIYLDSSSNNTIVNNTVNSNGWQYFIGNGIYLDSSSDNIIANNTANSNDVYGIKVDFSSNNTITNNTANSNIYGIHLWFSSNNTLYNNTANNNLYGLYLVSSSNNILANNTARSNGQGGIRLDSSSNNTIVNNTASHNHFNGLYLISSSGNTIENNEILSNILGISCKDSNSTINSNIVCGSTAYDFDPCSCSCLSYGDNNTCDNAGGWNDINKTGCTNKCNETTKTYSVSLNYGWNLISIPIHPKNTSIKSVLSSVEGKYTKVGAWINGAGKHYIPGFPFNTLTSIDEKMGFWIKPNFTP